MDALRSINPAGNHTADGSDSPSLFPCLFLLEAVCDQFHKLPSILLLHWFSFKDDLLSVLESIKTNLQTANELSSAIDRELVPFLQSRPSLLSLFHGYLPQPDQSWLEFMNSTLTEQELELAVRVMDSSDQQVQYVEAGCFLINQLEKRIKGTNMLNPHANRARISDRAPPNYHKLEEVFYVTDRKVTGDGEFSGNKGETLYYGSIMVGIPAKKLPSPNHTGAAYHSHTDAVDSYVIVLSDKERQTQAALPRTGAEEKFFSIVNKKVKECYKLVDGGEVLIYIHGYNVSFKEAVERAGQLKVDLKFDGTFILYSWASKGTAYAYFHDAKNAENTEECLRNFIQSCYYKMKGSRFHIIAQGLASKTLFRALDKLSFKKKDKYNDFEAHREPNLPLIHIVLIGADDNRESVAKLSNWHGSLHPTSQPRYTWYCSTEDYATTVSGLINGVNRDTLLGDTRSHLILDSLDMNVDVIDVTPTHTLHHSYYEDVPKMLKDIEDLLRGEYEMKEGKQWGELGAAKSRTGFKAALLKFAEHRDFPKKFFYCMGEAANISISADSNFRRSQLPLTENQRQSLSGLGTDTINELRERLRNL